MMALDINYRNGENKMSSKHFGYNPLTVGIEEVRLTILAPSPPPST
jgi:hypothetical protein